MADAQVQPNRPMWFQLMELSTFAHAGGVNVDMSDAMEMGMCGWMGRGWRRSQRGMRNKDCGSGHGQLSWIS